MDDRGERRTPVNSLMARYSYLQQTGQTSLSPGPGFDPSLSNIPLTMASSAGMSMPSFRPGQNVISDMTDTVVSQTDDAHAHAHSAGKNRNRQQNMDTGSYTCKEDNNMHGIASRDAGVGNMYGYSNYMNPPGNSFVPESMGDRADLFMSQLGLTGRLPTSMYSSLPPQDSGNHRGGESAGLSPLHSAAERSILSRSVPPYLPLGTESNYVYFNPPALSSLGAAELSLSASMHGSLGSFVSPPPSYSPSSAASRLRTCFPTVTSSAYNLSMGAQQESTKQSTSTAESASNKECYDMPWNLTHAPHEWNSARKSTSRRDMEMFEAQYKHNNKSASPNSEPDLQSVIDQSMPPNFESNNKKNEMKMSSAKTDTFTGTSQNGPYFQAVHQGSSERMFQDNSDAGIVNTDFRNISSHATTTTTTNNNKTMSAVGVGSDQPGEGVKYNNNPPPNQHGRRTKEVPKRIEPTPNIPLYCNAGTMTTQSMNMPISAGAGQSTSAGGSSTPAPFSVTPSMYSDSSENEQSIDQISSTVAQKVLDATEPKETPRNPNHSKFNPIMKGGAVQWKKKQLQQSKHMNLGAKSGLQAYQFDTHKQEDELSPSWQTFTKVSDISEEEEGLISPPRIRLVIKKSIPSKLPGSRTKASYSTASMGFGGKGKGRLDKRTCGICQKTFSRADSLTCHMRVHTGDRPYQCQLCDANYKIAGQLRDHVRSKHSSSRPFVCTKCGKDFAYPTARRRHEKVCGMDLSERIEFQCPTCDKGFVTAKGFSKHLQTCAPNVLEHGIVKGKDSPFRCSACDKAFTSYQCLDRHQRFICGRIPQKGIYSCEECGKMFHTRNRYVTHTRRHVGEKPYSCSKCELSFFDKGTLKRHIERWHEGSGKFNCTPCGKNFYDVRSWKKHMQQQHDSQFVEPPHHQGRRMKQHMCKMCGRSFIWRCLRSHVASEHPGKSLSEALSKELLKCDICSKEFSSYQILRVHKRGHCSSQRFKCEKCNMQFAVKSVLGYHIQMHCQQTPVTDNIAVHMGVGSGDRPYQCQVCGACYKIASHLRDHVRSKHSNSRPFLCAKCGKDFAYSTARRRHEKVCGVDLSERIQFQCTACDKGFVTAKGYAKHQVTCANLCQEADAVEHKIEMPFKCNSCEKSFVNFPSLDRHQRFICGRIPQKGIYACEECGKMFYKRDRYITHTRRHVGEKPYKCEQCELSFYDTITLKTHMEKWHEGSGKYKCSLCDKDFFFERTWKKHLHQHSMQLTNSLKPLHKENLQGRMMKQYTCKICHKSFVWRELCAHMASEHPGTTTTGGQVASSGGGEPVDKELLKCDVCFKEFSCPQSLMVHKKKHSSFKRYKCDRCDMQFAIKSSFLAHCRTHADGRPHRCEDCGKTFRWLHSLAHHRTTQHSGEDNNKGIERYTCHECGKHFKQENFLYLHLKLKQHDGAQDTPCICAQCGRGFIKVDDYKTHLATHNNSNNSMAHNSNNSNISTSMGTNTMSSTIPMSPEAKPQPGMKPFSCLLCGIGFQYKNLLDRHMKRTHNQLPNQSYLSEVHGKSLMHHKDHHLKNQVAAAAAAAVHHSQFPIMAPEQAKQQLMTTFPPRETSSVNPPSHTPEKRDLEGHMGGLGDRPYLPSTSSQELSRGDNFPDSLPLPNDALPHFSTFENQSYPRQYSTFIHQTLAWPRPEGHCTEEG